MTTSIRLVLKTPEDLTPEVVTSLLRNHDPAVEVEDVRVRHRWQGTASHVHLDVDYGKNDMGLPRHLFVKTQLSSVHDLPQEVDGELSEDGGATAIFGYETSFYRDVRPALTGTETLEVFDAEMLAGPSQFVIIAEDVTDRDARFPDLEAGLTVEEVDALLACLAGVHAPFWNSPRLGDDGDLSWLEHPVSGRFAEFIRADGFPIIRASLEVPYKKALLEKAGATADSLESAFWALADRTAEAPMTLLHGDPHPGNTYILPHGRVGVLDWQLVRKGSWAHDVSYALVGALEPELRRRHERDLLERYRSELVAAGVESPPTWDEIWAAYSCGPAWGFCMWAITPDQMYSEAKVAAVLGRFAEAYSDLGTGRRLR